MWEYRRATRDEVAFLWDENIRTHTARKTWEQWKEEYLYYLDHHMALTFAALQNGVPVGEGTLLLSPDCKAVRGRSSLCDGKTIANVNALRIRRTFEGQGHISALMKVLEREAAAQGISMLTIGVQEDEARNRAIYRHWGYLEPVLQEREDGVLVLYFAKHLSF